MLTFFTMHTKEILLHLSLIDGVGAATIATIIVNMPGSINLADVYRMQESDLGHYFGLSFTHAQNIKNGLANLDILIQELALINKHKINWATILCPEYPNMLLTIHMLPPVVYWAGNNIFNEKAVAIVGSRAANQYGKSVIQKLVPSLVQAGYTIVSGGALGADAMAHQATLDANGKTIIVLGSGLLKPNPPSNRKLFEDVIAQDGVMLSTFALAQDPHPGNFPARNCIISGLCKGSIIIQAAAKSGALITARFALEQGREVFAVPGSIHDDLSAGCHGLIGQGAKLITSAQDVLIEFGDIHIAQEISEKKKQKNQSITNDQLSINAAQSVRQELLTSCPISIILNSCRQPCSIDELAHTLNMDLATVQSLLFNLQLEGKIKQNFMGMWQSSM